MVLMVQYEVAKRICARVPDMNLLALSVQAYGRPEIIRKVFAGSFHPRPKVDSAIIRISDISDEWFTKNKIDPKKLFALARLAFSQKRKMLRHSIGKKINLPEKHARNATYNIAGGYQTMRPEELSLENWLQLIKYYDKIRL